MKFKITKIDAAVDQLDWAIKLFLDHSAYVSAITLSGAAEEIIGGTLPGSAISQPYLNKDKSWVMQWREVGEETIEIDLETEVIQYILRAVTSLFAHDQSLSSESPRFLEWLNKNKPEILDGLEFQGHFPH